MVMLKVALDASGSAGQGCLCVAGFVSNVEDWESFGITWNDRLAKDGIEYLHMHEYVSSRLQFKDWDSEKKRVVGTRLLDDLIGIIEDHVYRKFGCIVFERLIAKLSDSNRAFYIMKHAYALAGKHVARDVRVWAINERMALLPALIFEDGDTGKGDLIAGLELDGWPTPDFKPKRDSRGPGGLLVQGFVPLQAADLLAHTYYSVAKEMDTSPDGTFNEKRRYRRFESLQGTIGYYSPENIREMDRMMTILQQQEEWAKSKGLPFKN